MDSWTVDCWKQYIGIETGVEVHFTPEGGTLFLDYLPLPLNLAEADFLAGCDGTRTVAQLQPGADGEDIDRVRLLLLVAKLVEEGRLTFSDQPRPREIRVTGSRRGFIPPHLTVELTAGCNLRCRHCYRESDAGKNSYLPTAELLSILQRLHDSGLRSVELTGGEPTLHRDFPDILEYCADTFALVGVLTNGTIVTPRILRLMESLGDRLLLSISLDGSTAEAHDCRRGVQGAFDRTTRNIQRLAQKDIKVRVSMSVDEESFADIEPTLLLARRLGAVAFSYAPVLPLGRGQDWAGPGWRLDGQEVMRAEQDLVEKYAGFLSVLTADQQCELEGGEPCGAGYRTFTMDPWGRIRPCAMYDPDLIVIGDLRTSSVEDVFANPATRAMAHFPPPNPSTCSGCRLELFCRYCGLRGLQGSQQVADCAWARLEEVQAVLRLLPAARGTKGPEASDHAPLLPIAPPEPRVVRSP